MTLRTKLISGYILIGSLAGLVGLVGAITSKKVHSQFGLVTRETIPTLQALYNLRFAGLRIVSSTIEYVFLAAEARTESDWGKTLKSIESEKALIEQGQRAYVNAFRQYQDLSRLYHPRDYPFLKLIAKTGQELQNLSEELIELKIKGMGGSRVLAKKEEFEKIERDFLAAINGAIENEKTQFNQHSEAVQQRIYTAVKAIILTVSLSLLLALGASIYMSRAISTPVARLRDAAIQIGKGQLDASVDIKAKDEIGVLAETLNYMRISLKNRLEELKEAHAQALREERLSLVGRMASTIIHDFRGPMQIIQGSAELLALPDMSDEKKERHSRIIIQQVDRMANMTRELLDFAKGESHTRRVVLDIEDLLTEINFQAEEFCRNTPVRVDVELKKPFQLWADKEKILRVFMNLIRNAKEAMAGGGEIRVTAFLDAIEGVIQVSDNGPGIPSELAGRLFQPFATFGKAGGTGLGLALSKKIVEEHNGSIQCESEPDKGTTFTIRLPAAERVALETLPDTGTTKIAI